MKRTVLGAIAFATLAAGAMGATGANAQTRGYYVERRDGPPVYAYQTDEYDAHHRHRCEAPQWDPNHRYLPGETVRRKGEVYVATETSRHVYNVNSPPEWTPNYWAPARCR